MGSSDGQLHVHRDRWRAGLQGWSPYNDNRICSNDSTNSNSRGSMGIMEKKMETTIVCFDSTNSNYRGFMGITENWKLL